MPHHKALCLLCGWIVYLVDMGWVWVLDFKFSPDFCDFFLPNLSNSIEFQYYIGFFSSPLFLRKFIQINNKQFYMIWFDWLSCVWRMYGHWLGPHFKISHLPLLGCHSMSDDICLTKLSDCQFTVVELKPNCLFPIVKIENNITNCDIWWF